MIDAYTIGITVALEDGVSAGVAAIRRDLEGLDRVIASTMGDLSTLRALAGGLRLGAAAGVVQPKRTGPADSKKDETPATIDPFAANATPSANLPLAQAAPSPPTTTILAAEPAVSKMIESSGPGDSGRAMSRASEMPMRGALPPASPSTAANPITPRVAPAPVVTLTTERQSAKRPAMPSPVTSPPPIVAVATPAAQKPAAPTATSPAVPVKPPLINDAAVAPPVLATPPLAAISAMPATRTRGLVAPPPPQRHERAAQASAEGPRHAALAPRTMAPRNTDQAPRATTRTREKSDSPGRSDRGETPGGGRGDRGSLHIDGAMLGHWLAEHLANETSRPPGSQTGFDARLGRTWPGSFSGR